MSSNEAGASSLLRWRPAVLGLTLVLGVLGIYYVRQVDDERDGAQGLHRSNAIRRRSPRLRHARPSIAQENGRPQENGRSQEQGRNRRESFAGTLDVPDDDTTVNAGDSGDGQSLLNMLYHIAVEQANREGYVHRGVTCNACNAYPIRGVRYRCANCPDYDLCEQCESLGNIHDRTHLFYKIRIPAPFLGANPRQQQAVWYPGKPHVNPRSVPNGLKKQLSEATGLDRSLIDALWDQFKTLAGCDWPEDPNGLFIAIDREIWAKYCVSPLSKRHSVSMALLFDRSFTFWDDNGDGLVGFEEFLQGLTLKQSKNKKEWNRRMFRAHDLDGDGFVTRQDFMSLFVAHYAYCKEQSRDMARLMEDEVLEGGQLKETLQSTQAVSSCFHGSIPPPENPRTGEGKVVNSVGDMVIADGGGLLRKEEDGMVDPKTEGTGQNAMADIFESLAQSMPDWPPDFVTPEDAHKALGRRSSLIEITEAAEQRRVLDAANNRLEPKQAEPKPSPPAANDESDVVLTPESEFCPSYDVEPEITRELLYQKSAEGLNELLDPMFKQLEDLAVFYLRTEKERSRLRQKIDTWKQGTGNLALCQKWLDCLLESWRRGDTRKAWLEGDRLAEDMISRLVKETQFGSNEWMLDAKERIRSGFTSEELDNGVIAKLQAMSGEEYQAKARELQRLTTAVRQGNNPTPEMLDQMLTETLLEEQVRDPLSPTQQADDEELADMSDDDDIVGPGMRPLDENTIAELLNSDALSHLRDGPEPYNFGADYETRVRSLHRFLAEAGFPEEVLTNVALPGSEPLAGGDLFVNQDFDPTLPHHRPNTVAEAEPEPEPRPYMTWSSAQLEGTMASMEEHDPYENPEGVYFGVKLKFLTILEMCAESAKRRCGWARINADEFDQIITGSKGSSLAPIGEWLFLANF